VVYDRLRASSGHSSAVAANFACWRRRWQRAGRPGAAGIGKTRLIEEVQRAATEAGFVCHVALVLDFGSGAGRDAIRALARSLLELEVTSDSEATRAAAATALSSDLVVSEDAV
jgi:hypothetical protein